jgi:hypothetical protein
MVYNSFMRMNNLIAAVMMLALLLATLGVWGSIAGYTLTGPEHDPLALFKLLSRMDLPAQIKDASPKHS